MRPTFSIIAFTVLSGIGYGAWFLFGLGAAIGPACSAGGLSGPSGATLTSCHAPFDSFAALLVASACVAVGLLCSLGHLGKPQRAWRAVSQWRTSWLSREGAIALLTFVPAAVLVVRYGLALQSPTDGVAVTELHRWNDASWDETGNRLLGGLVALGSLATVFCTANIYASLKPIRAWHERHVVPAYLLLGLYGGTLLLHATTTLSGATWHRDRLVLLVGTIALAAGCGWIKLRYWRSIDAQSSIAAGQATGLETLGVVRAFEAPHTEENYLLHEMGFMLARKHARALRRIALVAAFAVPALLAAVALALPAVQVAIAWLALASGLAGLFVERWLFFAEAKHAVTAYYRR
ncbi:dimethyl sulfoxide reductase anchor subunit family protein [Dokdonella sp.]|uniref:dimethyl sulfoxide reductase anchor subunit family protein n=1 Tax=Dokdonella sp. TaxID=2291710 RepID=UPI002F405B90